MILLLSVFLYCGTFRLAQSQTISASTSSAPVICPNCTQTNRTDIGDSTTIDDEILGLSRSLMYPIAGVAAFLVAIGFTAVVYFHDVFLSVWNSMPCCGRS